MLSHHQRAEIEALLSKLPPNELEAALSGIDGRKSIMDAFLLGVKLSARNAWFASAMGVIQTFSTYCPICYPPHPEVIYLAGPDGLGHSATCTQFGGHRASLTNSPAANAGSSSVLSRLRNAARRWLSKCRRRPPRAPNSSSS
jgi:hypothetical protein